MDHRQLQVRGRVIHRQAAGFGQRHDEQRGEGQRWPGLIAVAGLASVWITMRPRLVEPAPSARPKIASAIVGSAMAATVISRLAPMPPKAVPGSSPASARKNVPSSKQIDHDQ